MGSSRVIIGQLLSSSNISSCKKRQFGHHGVHPDGHHEEVGLTGVVQEPAHVPHPCGIHEGLHDPPVVQVLPDCNDVVWLLWSLCLAPPLSLGEAQHLSSILTDKTAPGDGLQCPNSPALPGRAEHLQPQPQPALHQPVLAALPAAAQAVTLKHGPGEGLVLLLLIQPEAQPAVVVAMAKAGALWSQAGAAAARAAREGDFSGVNLSVCSGHVVRAVLQREQQGEPWYQHCLKTTTFKNFVSVNV